MLWYDGSLILYFMIYYFSEFLVLRWIWFIIIQKLMLFS
jgi:hypothetical protein